MSLIHDEAVEGRYSPSAPTCLANVLLQLHKVRRVPVHQVIRREQDVELDAARRLPVHNDFLFEPGLEAGAVELRVADDFSRLLQQRQEKRYDERTNK